MLITSSKSYGVDRLKMVVFGPSGHGKTTLAGTIEEPTLIISAEAGLLSIADKDIPSIDVTIDDNGKLIEKEKRIARLEQVYKYLLTPEAQKEYQWVFIDSLTEISQNLSEKLSREFPDRKDGLVLWGEYTKQMRSLVKSFRDLPYYNVVFTALSSKEKDENGSYVTTINVNGKQLPEEIPQYFDLVLYLHADTEGKRKLITQPISNIKAKARGTAGNRLDQLEEPNLAMIAKKIRG